MRSVLRKTSRAGNISRRSLRKTRKPCSSRSVIDRARRQIGLFTTLLLTVSTVIIGLIIYTMTIDKKKSIATLKLIGAPDRRIVGLIVQQALAMGVISFMVGAALINAGQGYFPRRVVLEPGDAAILFGVVLVRVPARERARGAHRAQDRSRVSAGRISWPSNPSSS